MDAYNYNLILGELCLLPNKNLDLNKIVNVESTPELVPEVTNIEPVPEVFERELPMVESEPEVTNIIPDVPNIVSDVPNIIPEVPKLRS